MKFKLAIGDKVTVPVFFKQKDGHKTKSFSFDLLMARVSPEEWQESIKGADGEVSIEKIKEKLLELTTGWVNQEFVLDEEGKPAEFSQEALEFMFSVPGVMDICLTSFIKESAAKGKN